MRCKTPSKAFLSKSMSIDGLPQIRQTPLGERLPHAFLSSTDLLTALDQKRKTFSEINQTTDSFLHQSLAQMSTPEPSLVDKLLIAKFHRVKKRKKKKAKVSTYEVVPSQVKGVRTAGGYEVYWETVDDEDVRPGAREGASMLTISGKVILMGGSSRQIFSDIWVLLIEYQRWTKSEIHSHEMIPRTGHSMVEFNQQIVIFGGETSSLRFTNHRECLNTVAMLNPGIMDLRSVGTSGQSVVMRRYHCAAEIGKHMFVHGGLTEKNQVLDDVLVLNLATWKWRRLETVGEAPGPRAFHTAVGVYSYSRGWGSKPGAQSERRVKEFGVYVFGGRDSQGHSHNSLHIIKLNARPYTWSVLPTFGTPPEPRFHHTMTYFQELCMIVVYGGRQDTRCESGYRCFGDVHLLHLDTLSWTTATSRGTIPESRCGHTATSLGSRLIIFGGIHNSHYASNETFALELQPERVFGMVERDKEREQRKKQLEIMRLQSQFEELKAAESEKTLKSPALAHFLTGLRRASRNGSFSFLGRMSVIGK